MPDQSPDYLQYLDPSVVALQKLEKKLRNWRNKGLATDADVAGVKVALEAVRAIYGRHKLDAVDIDSRAEKRHRREQDLRGASDE